MCFPKVVRKCLSSCKVLIFCNFCFSKNSKSGLYSIKTTQIIEAVSVCTCVCINLFEHAGNEKKVKHLLGLANASTNLSLWKADLTEEDSYDDAIQGCEGVFHVATPMELLLLKDNAGVYIYIYCHSLFN